MEIIDDAVVRSRCLFRDSSFVFRPSIGRSGDILLVWNSMLWQIVDFYVGVYSMSALVRDVCSNIEWVATPVYAPNRFLDRNSLCGELSYVAGRWYRPWVIGGDFNII